ncbi:MAG TPA: hypothetical protein PKV96_02680, partial [Candidatus Saccharimonas sp.]|nr:hypothetical protein [Candidatus Saccharimonas sp.]
ARPLLYEDLRFTQELKSHAEVFSWFSVTEMLTARPLLYEDLRFTQELKSHNPFILLEMADFHNISYNVWSAGIV